LVVTVTKGKTDGLTKNQKDLCANPYSATGEHGSCLHPSLKHPHTLIHSGLHFIYCSSHKIWMPTRYWRTHENKMGTMKYKISQHLALGEL